MAKEPDSNCSCVIDTDGLHELATTSGNLKARLIARLEDGTIGVPSWAWQEFKELYEEEAKKTRSSRCEKNTVEHARGSSGRADYGTAELGFFAGCLRQSRRMLHCVDSAE
jgi:hypothetical protein